MKTFVEPVLMWKGDTVDAPSGNANPEGSDADPGLNESPVADAARPARPFTSQAGDGVPALLWNNQYAALYEVDDD